MDLGFTEEQETLRDSARAFVESEVPASLARTVDAEETDRIWRRMVDLGWPAVTVPEAAGGAGMTFVDLLVLLEQVGRVIAPGPLLATTSQFVPALLACEPGPLRDQLLAGVVRGETGTLALAEGAASGEPGAFTGVWAWEATETAARKVGSSWVVSGAKRHVLEGAHAGELLVLARASDGLALLAVPAQSVDSEPLPAIDPTLRLATVALRDVEVPDERVLARPGSATAVLERSMQESVVAVAMVLVGLCSSILERTVDYAKTRRQFDQPIGGFQAVKHKLADMYVAVERARSLAYFAGLTISEDDPRRAIASSMAKAAAGDCQRLVVHGGLQLHGGIGYTWEYDLHLALKRALALESLLGSSVQHRRRVARELGLL